MIKSFPLMLQEYCENVRPRAPVCVCLCVRVNVCVCSP